VGKRQVLSLIIQLLAGIVLVVALGWGARAWLARLKVAHLPPGWAILRPPSEASALLVVGDTVWCGGKDGLTCLDRDTGKPRALPGTPPAFSYVRALLRDKRGQIWLAHDAGLARYAGGRWRVIAPGPELTFTRAGSLLETRDGAVWVGGSAGLARLSGAHWRVVKLPKRITAADVLLDDRDGALWVGCAQFPSGGLARYSGGRWSVFDHNDGLPHPAVNALYEDNDGSLWAATGIANQGGLAVRRDERWQASSLPPALQGAKIRSIYQDTAGRLWFGSEYDGIVVQAGGVWHRFTDRDGLAGYEVKVMTQDSDGVYWLGTNAGVSRITRFATLDGQKAGKHDLH